MGGRENKGNFEGGTDEYLEEKTPVEIKQRLHTSRMDARLRTPSPRGKRGGRVGKIKQQRIELGNEEEA